MKSVVTVTEMLVNLDGTSTMQEVEREIEAQAESPYRLRIIAPAALADERPELLLYLYKCERVRGMPVEREGNNIVIYCNEILEGDVGVIKSEPRVSVEALSEAGAKHLRGIGFDFEK